ncbi:MAG: hypothetical protein ACERKV_05220 [Clostridiaceae bacterium]
MEDTDRYYKSITSDYDWNCFNSHASILQGLIFLTSLQFGGFCIMSIFLYLLTIFIFSTKYLFSDRFNLNKYDSMNALLIMPFSRENIYKTYVKMMFVQAVKFIVFGCVIDIIRYLILNYTNNKIMIFFNVKSQTTLNTINSRITYYLLAASTLFVLLIFLVKLINKYSKKFLLSMFIGLFLWNMYAYILFLNFISNNSSALKQNIVLSLIIFSFIFICYRLYINIKRNYNTFLLGFREEVVVSDVENI